MVDKLTKPSVWLPLLSLVLVLGGWEIIGRSINPLLFAPPSGVLQQFGLLIETGELWAAA